MQGKITKDMLIEDALRLDRNTLKIFTKYGIDACCGSHDTIEAESRKRRVDVNKIITELNEVIQEV
ncbi:MAG: DUF542 domain-containing protein [Candidatus Hydrothermarchaeota archaeon]|jgi:regulator of cell morphogenesis and NO signaling|nr:DUF542 domain-containing protein [Candidatus Hydrothermarchaeota archaeon]